MGGSVDEAREWLRLARESLGAAELLADRGFLRDSVSKSYYAMFYATKAAVISEGLDANKHSAVISAFGQRFSKSGRVQSKFPRSLRNAFDERQLADYTLEWEVSQESSKQRLAEARDFVVEIHRLLSPGSRPSPVVQVSY